MTMVDDAYCVELSSESLFDIQGIVFYISNNLYAPSVADRIATDLLNKASTLSLFPHRYPVAYIGKSKIKYHRMNIEDYSMFYFIDEEKKKVIIARVLHETSDYPNHLNDVVSE